MNNLQMVFFKVMVGDAMSAVFADEKQAVDHAKKVKGEVERAQSIKIAKFLISGHKYLFTNNVKQCRMIPS
nr:MAG TPA: hypothetical protein [Caudoviricetes sp.]